MKAGTYINNVKQVRLAHPDKPSQRGVVRKINALVEKFGWRKRSPESMSALEKGKSPLSDEWIKQLTTVLNCTPAALRDEGRQISGMAEEAVRYIPGEGSRLARAPLGDHEFYYKMAGKNLDDLGVHDGDVLTVSMAKDLLENLKIGDIVIAQVYSGTTATTIVRQFVPPHLLISNSRCDNLQPINMVSTDCLIRGLVVSISRERS